MRHERLDSMVRGWFVGAFRPTALHSEACEVAARRYAAGDAEAEHFHLVATEVTLVLSGRVRMAGREWGAGDIVVLEPGDVSGFEALEDSMLVVVKVPGALDDKHVVGAAQVAGAG